VLTDPKLRQQLRGIHITMVTPFDRSFAVDEARLRALVDLVIANGVDVINYPLTNGEAASLTFEEHRRALTVVAEQVAGRVPFYAGVPRTSTWEAVALAAHAEAVGASGVVGLQPYYFKLAQAEIHEHFRRLAQASRLPMIVYNHPLATKISISVEESLRLAELPTVVGFFPTNTDAGELYEFSAALRDKLLLIGGREEVTLFTRLLGFEGQSSSVFHFAPALMREIWTAVQSGDDGRAAARFARLAAWRRLVKRRVEAGYFGAFATYTKASMDLLGWPVGDVRPPLVPLEPAEREELRLVLERDLELSPGQLGKPGA
jgi:4-hydroxy-tetrahydrodipicolinate synthase